MSDPKLIILVQLDESNQMTVKLGTHHEALLALALRKAQLSVDNVLLEKELMAQEANKPLIEIPKNMLDKI